jgi:NAD(P)-dependent dehydrogenase (short-subunit alcohol dehydrogenase family)
MLFFFEIFFFLKFQQEAVKAHPLGRIGTPEECAKLIAFLASDDASFITGELVHIDGGRHALTP